LSLSDFRFPKNLRIHKGEDIEQLFNESNSFLVFPFKVLWTEKQQSTVPLSILISVPKNKISKANRRNSLKRLARESFRLNKNHLVNLLLKKNKSILLALIYVHDNLTDYEKTEKAMQKILLKLEGMI